MNQAIKTAPTVIASFTGEEFGVTTFVVRVGARFAVHLRDDDAGEIFPSTNDFADLAAAKAYAKRSAGLV